MQHDEVIWQVINQGFCSYKVKTPTVNFCKNKYNVTGLCNRSSCPLANSRYATVLEEQGVCYLYIKTIERAHLPAKMWEKTRLHSNYATALAQITEALQFWPNFNVHKCKQRLTKIHQYLIRMRRLKLKVRTKLVGAPKKIERREATREKKAEKAARLDDAIVKELVARLHAGTYSGSGLYLPEKAYSKVLDLVGETEEVEDEIGEDEEEEDEEENDHERELEDGEGEDGELEDGEEDDDDDGEEYVADFGDEDDLEDIAEAFRGTPLDGPEDDEGGDPSAAANGGGAAAAAAAAALGRGRKRGASAASADDDEDAGAGGAAAAAAAGPSSGRAAKKSRAAPAKPAAKGGRRAVNIQYEQEVEQERELDR